MTKTRGVKGPATTRISRKTSIVEKALKQTRTTKGVTKPTQPRGRSILLKAAEKNMIRLKRTTDRLRKIQTEKDTETLLVKHI